MQLILLQNWEYNLMYSAIISTSSSGVFPCRTISVEDKAILRTALSAVFGTEN
jgi:hypothetical protein